MVERREDGRVADAMQELDALLEGIGQKIAASSDTAVARVAPARSGRLYRTITRYWPRIAAGLVGFAFALDFFVGRLAAEEGLLEFYVFAWASTTGGLWFLFEKAEKSLSEDTRGQVARWLAETDARAAFRSIPKHFAVAFDRVFGDRHFSLRCFLRSSLASILTVPIVALLVYPHEGDIFQTFGLATILAIPFNVVPDYISLLQTRWAIGWIGRSGRTLSAIGVDLVVTAVISFSTIYVVTTRAIPMEEDISVPQLAVEVLWPENQRPCRTGDCGGYELFGLPEPPPGEWEIYRIFFYSAFFTSMWLWLYAGSVLASRLLLRLNSGVGFLLRATDLEEQPFRSLGFVSVLIASLIFVLGLPLVLL